MIRHSPSDEGAAAVEFALVSMILVTLLIGIMQFGYLFYQWNEITHAAREGARWAALEYPAGSVVTPDTVRYKVAQAAPGMELTDADITVSPTAPTIEDVGDPATVTVTWAVPLFTPLMQSIFSTSDDTFVLRSTATLRIE
ncbi:MAG: pilus assembly protein [Coriobacteriia bacterium]|nr:pilus assembly protein [Coriobacteriia bacterium]MBN2821957.1 pilus assembly protein [Coriobacteriia bacterium]